MKKGSQLSQLRSALAQAGVTKTSQNGKKRKRSGSIDQDKIKKAAKLQEIHQKLNPFDVKVTRLKHDVGGRKIRGTKGQPAQSKQAGIQQVRHHIRGRTIKYIFSVTAREDSVAGGPRERSCRWDRRQAFW